MASLTDIEHLLFLLAEDVPVTALRSLPGRVTTCRGYHLTPEDEEREARSWPAYAAALRDAHVTVHLRASMPDTLGEVTVIEARQETVEAVVDRLGALPPGTVVAIALAGGDAEPVHDDVGALGAPGTLLLHTPWSGADWVSEEVCDHTSLMQLCERWTAARGHEAPARLTSWRRRVCGDLVGALDLGDDLSGEPDLPGRALARPLPYRPEVGLRWDGGAVGVLLSNAGTGATRAVHLVVDDGTTVRRDTIPASSPDRPKEFELPVTVEDGRYDVTVTGPNRFRRRLAGSVPDAGLSCTAAPLDGGGVRLGLVLSHADPTPVTFTLTSRPAGRPAAVRRVAVAPGEVVTVEEEPWREDHGWYDVAVSAETRPGWVREYTGHLEADDRVARTFPQES